MNGSLLLAPLLLIRYGLIYCVNRDALKRAAFYPPAQGAEKAALILYQLATAGLLIVPFFLSIRPGNAGFWGGLTLYGVGIALLAVSTANFAGAPPRGFCQTGLYRFSRNPMYVGYFICFLGCALLTRSLLLLAVLFIFQGATHFLILAEERWCKAAFGPAYARYMKTVRRYL